MQLAVPEKAHEQGQVAVVTVGAVTRPEPVTSYEDGQAVGLVKSTVATIHPCPDGNAGTHVYPSALQAGFAQSGGDGHTPWPPSCAPLSPRWLLDPLELLLAPLECVLEPGPVPLCDPSVRVAPLSPASAEVSVMSEIPPTSWQALSQHETTAKGTARRYRRGKRLPRVIRTRPRGRSLRLSREA
jgi:hypothetical protein